MNSKVVSFGRHQAPLDIGRPWTILAPNITVWDEANFGCPCQLKRAWMTWSVVCRHT